jgi:hypothetical protein
MAVRAARALTLGVIAALGSGAAVALGRSEQHLRGQLRSDQALSGPELWLPWAVLATLVVTAAIATLFFFRHAADNARLTSANSQLDLLANLDGLTGAWNRRQMAGASRGSRCS